MEGGILDSSSSIDVKYYIYEVTMTNKELILKCVREKWEESKMPCRNGEIEDYIKFIRRFEKDGVLGETITRTCRKMACNPHDIESNKIKHPMIGGVVIDTQWIPSEESYNTLF